MLGPERMVNMTIFPHINMSTSSIENADLAHSHKCRYTLAFGISPTFLFVPDSLGNLEQIAVPFAVYFLAPWCSKLCFPLSFLMF